MEAELAELREFAVQVFLMIDGNEHMEKADIRGLDHYAANYLTDGVWSKIHQGVIDREDEYRELRGKVLGEINKIRKVWGWDVIYQLPIADHNHQVIFKALGGYSGILSISEMYIVFSDKVLGKKVQEEFDYVSYYDCEGIETPDTFKEFIVWFDVMKG